jgi:hypothetical protein
MAQTVMTVIASSIKSPLTSKVLQRLPIISNILRLKSGSSSRKEENTVTAPLDRPILVLTVSLPRRRLVSISDAGFFI